MTNKEICELYDSHLTSMTLAKLSRITGYTIDHLKEILMDDSEENSE